MNAYQNQLQNQLHCICISNPNYLLKPTKPIICIGKGAEMSQVQLITQRNIITADN